MAERRGDDADEKGREGLRKLDADCIYVYYLTIDVHYVSEATEMITLHYNYGLFSTGYIKSSHGFHKPGHWARYSKLSSTPLSYVIGLEVLWQRAQHLVLGGYLCRRDRTCLYRHLRYT